jgi:hypothetical protein
MSQFFDFSTPTILSNLVAIFLIFLCFRSPKAGKNAFTILFVAAGIFNIITATISPQIYVEGFGPNATLRAYENFIYGAFKESPALYVIPIGIGQIAVGLLLLIKNVWYKLGVIGGIIFFIAIAPLGAASAFPTSLLLAFGLVVLAVKKDDLLDNK